VRELKDSPYIDNAAKNPNFVNGRWTTMIGDLEDISPPLKTPLQGDIDK